MSDSVTKVKSSLKWSAVERLLTQGIQLGITLFLARLLGPVAFGLIGMLAVFIALANVFVDSGFTAALIRKADRINSDLVTAFYYNVLMSTLCYLVLYFSAPYISYFYHLPELQALLRILGLTVLVNSLTLIPRVRLTILMDFKTQAKISIVSALVSGFFAVLLAMSGYGVWALVAQTLLNSCCSAILFNIISPWRPKGKVTKESFNYLFGFGSKLLVSSLLDVAYNNSYQIIIGKNFSPKAVGQFTQANQLASIPAMTMTGIIQRVTFPLFSNMQEDDSKMANSYRITLKMAAVVIFPTIAGLGVIAQPLLTVLLGEQWQTAAILLTILCLGYMLYPIHAVNLNLLQVTGRSDLFLKLEVIKKIIGLSILLLTIPFGVLVMCVGLSVTSYLALFLNTYYTAKLTSLSQWQQCKDLLPIWLVVMVSALLGYVAGLYLVENSWLKILVSLFFSLSSYASYLLLFQKDLMLRMWSACVNKKTVPH